MDTVYTLRPDLSSPDARSAAYYAIIPANVRYNQKLSANAKLLYGEISALASREGYCFASNQYFADLYQVTPRSVIRMVKQLEDGGFIRTQEERDKETGQCKGRRIYLAVSTSDEQPGDKIVTPSGQNCQEGGDKNVTPLLLINNNKYINSAVAEKSEKDSAVRAQFAAWLQTQSAGWYEKDTARVLEAFTGFLEARRKNKKPVKSSRAVTLLCNRLAQYSSGSPIVMADMLDTAVLHGWQSIYPPDGDRPAKVSPRKEADTEWL